MAEEIPFEPPQATGQQDDVVGKIDQLLNRHRPKTPANEAIPVLMDAPADDDIPRGDGIPVLTDVVNGRDRPAGIPSAPPRSGTISSGLILQRMEIALDVEHIRLLAQIDRDDPEQARRLDRLVAELKRALPGAISSAIGDKTPDPD